jgi:Fur family transcriptional regulator, ferric uptake regulator
MMSEQSDILGMLRRNGHRVTPQRVMILEAVRKHGGHMSAEEVFRDVQVAHPYVNRSTVYRTLDMLTKEGLVTVTDLGKGPVHYEFHSGEPHHHLVCQSCGKIEEFDHDLLQPLQQALEHGYKFHARLDHMAIFGLCAKCQAKSMKSGSAR